MTRFSKLFVAPLAALLLAAAPPDDNDKQITEAHFVSFQPIIMTVVQERQIQGLVQLEVTLRLYDPTNWDRTSRLRARLKDRLVQAVAGLTNGAIRVDAPINIPLITAVMQRQIDKELGPDYARVLITDATTRKQ
ncbi:MAG: hypothetical protein AAGJ09_06590 [Pseudomonadota bacterium]